ncbi:hypothetical protein DFP96_10230 [Listeria rocourtiae]|uniref:Uncharacterized protein n=1 Tax=Listeria rocourtiae TaxID=647910 RepID=A0A4R6ZPG4_9LIST|nr:hypothetical protein DFP96_10230 [Listeria rocourtiae]
MTKYWNHEDTLMYVGSCITGHYLFGGDEI